jgi:VIT1/CCC1 family predicted Fe2+/Mn2+ transporter
MNKVSPHEKHTNNNAQKGTLRAAVFGVNDGLVSNLSLVMGFAGAQTEPKFILLAGVAGLLAGAFSMAAGEFISMKVQREVFEKLIELEKTELKEVPEKEHLELRQIYENKGLRRKDAEQISRLLMSDEDLALETHLREELGLNPDELGSPTGAAASSFGAFVIGAAVPVIPYLLTRGSLAFYLSIALSALGLMVVGSLLSSVTGRNWLFSGLRMLLIGGAAAGVTYGIGYLLGVSMIN